MKVAISLIALILQATNALSTTTAELAQECGALDIMEIPDGANPNDYRHCKSHPLGPDRRIYANQDLAAGVDPSPKRDLGAVKAADIFGREALACWWDAPLGCTDGYCWKSCGNPGEWCWTAYNNGVGDWARCGRAGDCQASDACGQGCKSGDKACGCSC
ncbi:hypothetical protein J1614_000919 [Plenodomus biglobosus]|nr:hypothetical protein J1614_000919 [Plenodomus biglobosus]